MNPLINKALSVLVVWCFAFLGPHNSVAQENITDRMELIREINSLLSELYETECSIEIIGKLEELLTLEEFRLSVADVTERKNYYLEVLSIHSKLGYLYGLAGKQAISEQHYGSAMELGSELNEAFNDKAYLERLNRRSSIGCFIRMGNQ